MVLATFCNRWDDAVWVPAFAGTTAAAPRGNRHLWDSYKLAAAPVSKIYAAGGTSQRRMRGRLFGPVARDALEQLMLDLVMLALALGFFAAGIGYAYACERL